MGRWQIPHSATQTIIYKHGADFASSTEVTVRGDAAEAVAKLLEQQGKSSSEAVKVGWRLMEIIFWSFREWNGVWFLFFFNFSFFLINMLSIHVYVMACFFLFSCACHTQPWMFFCRPMWKSTPPRRKVGKLLLSWGFGGTRYDDRLTPSTWKFGVDDFPFQLGDF